MKKEINELIRLHEQYNETISVVENMLKESSQFRILSLCFLYPYGWTINIEQNDVIDFEINITEEELVDISIEPKLLDEKITNFASEDEIKSLYLKKEQK